MKRLFITLISILLISAVSYANCGNNNGNGNGCQGDTGPQGTQGIQGSTGASGPQGLTGTAYSQPLIIPALDINIILLESKKMDVGVFNTFMFNSDMLGVRMSFRPFHTNKK